MAVESSKASEGLSWDDEDFDVEAVVTKATPQRRAATVVCAMVCQSGRNEQPELALPTHLAGLASKTGSARLATTGFLSVEALEGELVESLDIAFGHDFDATRFAAESDHCARVRVSASSLAVVETVVPRRGGFAEERCVAFLCHRLRRLAGLHPRLKDALGAVVGDAPGAESCLVTGHLELQRLRPVGPRKATAQEHYLCHSQVEVGFLALIVPLSEAADVCVADATRPSAPWVEHRLSREKGHVSCLIVGGRSAERLAGLPAAPWCLMGAAVADRAVPAHADIVVVRLLPWAALEMGGPGLSIFATPQQMLHLAPPVLEGSANQHLGSEMLMVVFLLLPLRFALRAAAVARVFASAKMLAARISIEKLSPVEVKHILLTPRLLRELQVIDASQLPSWPPPFALLRTVVVAAPLLRKLRLPHWPGLARTLRRLKRRLEVELAPAECVLVDHSSHVTCHDWFPRHPAPLLREVPVALTLHRFLALFSASLEDTPEWRRGDGARPLSMQPSRFAYWVETGRQRHLPLTLPPLYEGAGFEALASLAHRRLLGNERGAVALFSDGERFGPEHSAVELGLFFQSKSEAVAGASLRPVVLDAVILGAAT